MSNASQSRSSKNSAIRNGCSGWIFPIALGLVIVGLIAWWMWPTLTGSGEAKVVEPIATIDAPDYHSLLIDPQDPNRILFGSHAGVMESQDGGYTWRPGTLHGVDAMIMITSPNAPETIYVAGHDVFQQSPDGGVSWEPVRHDLPGTDIHGFAQDPIDPKRLYAFVVGAGGLTSADGGSTWEAFASQPPGGSYMVLASNGTELFAATDAGISRSRDHGITWEPLAAQPGKVTALSLAVSSDDPKVVFVGTPGGSFKSTDGGETWAPIGPIGVPTLALAIAPGDPNQVLALDHQGGIYRSNDGGNTWESP